MTRKNIDTTDLFRPLLTDTLPYETPFTFSNHYFHAFAKRHMHSAPVAIKRALLMKKTRSTPFTKPIEYEIDRPSGSKRRLSVLHPAAQLRFCQFYDRFSDVIVYSTSKSPFSLRYPAGVARRYYEREGLAPNAADQDRGEVEVEAEAFVSESAVASSYFFYKNYAVQHKFFDSNEFLRLEQRYKYLATVDVHKCFNNLYTHSLPWAVKGRVSAKANRNESSFENRFDSLMQFSNYGETNGIPIGPEVSRIYSEIVFQSLDLLVERELKGNGLQMGRDYELGRYVDDYFIFSSSERCLSEISEIIEDVLESNRLYLNKLKSKTTSRPFFSEISSAKMEASRSLSAFIDSLVSNVENLKYRGFAQIKRQFVNEIRKISITTGSGFEAISKFVLSSFLRRIRSIFVAVSGIEDREQRAIFVQKVSVIFGDVSAYLYSVAPNVRSSFLVCRIYLLVEKASKSCSDDACREVNHVLVQHLRAFFATAEHQNELGVAEMNLLILERRLSRSYRLQGAFLKKWFGIKSSNKSPLKSGRVGGLNYFQICTLLYYIKDDVEYGELSASVSELIEQFFSVSENVSRLITDAESLMLCLDLLACPWVSDSTKSIVSRALVMSADPNVVNANKILEKANQLKKFCGKRIWFFDWSAGQHLERLLKKKELIPAYS